MLNAFALIHHWIGRPREECSLEPGWTWAALVADG